MEPYVFLEITGIITLAFGVILKSKKVFFTQLVFLIGIFLLTDTTLNLLYYSSLYALQSVISALVLLRYKKAIDRNYKLILEKTHKIPRNLTKGGDLGSQSSFFEKK
nr:hypothetical protein [Fredinandcohnia onubensis]